MTDQTAIEAATKRLAQALDALDAAVERRLEADRSRGHARRAGPRARRRPLQARRRSRRPDRPLAPARNRPTARSRAGSTRRWRTSARCSTRSSDSDQLRIADVRRSTSPSTAASSAWPARTGQEDHLRQLAKDLDERIDRAARPVRRDRRHAAHRHGGADGGRRTGRGRQEAAAPGGGPRRAAGRARRRRRPHPGDAGRHRRPHSTRPPSGSRAWPRSSTRAAATATASRRGSARPQSVVAERAGSELTTRPLTRGHAPAALTGRWPRPSALHCAGGAAGCVRRHIPRGLTISDGSCPWPGPWSRSYGAHLLL